MAAELDAIYLPVTVPEEKLGSVTDVFRSCFSGFNVTIPYKERIIPYLDDVDDAVKACGAVNTVDIREGRMIGHITDGLGMLRAIEECGIVTEGIDVLILGGGGAARVAGYEFLSRGGNVMFAVRSMEKGERLANELAETQSDGRTRIHSCLLTDIIGAHDILINCTPVGMYPNTDAMPVSEKVISRCAAVFDAVYNPRKTQLLACAEQRGIPCVEGLGMLFYQAVEAQKLWLGSSAASESEQTRIYRELQSKL